MYSDRVDLFEITDGNWSRTARYNKAGVTALSDLRGKKDIESLGEKYSILFDNLTPVRFKYITDDRDAFHTGFIAQEVESAVKISGLTEQDFAALSKGNEQYGLNYTEFIALCVYEIQQLKAEINELKTAKNAE